MEKGGGYVQDTHFSRTAMGESFLKSFHDVVHEFLEAPIFPLYVMCFMMTP